MHVGVDELHIQPLIAVPDTFGLAGDFEGCRHIGIGLGICNLDVVFQGDVVVLLDVELAGLGVAFAGTGVDDEIACDDAVLESEDDFGDDGFAVEGVGIDHDSDDGEEDNEEDGEFFHRPIYDY